MTEQSTKWYENVEQGTFHEVLEGSDTEKHMKRQMRQVGADEDDVELAYRPVSKSDVAAASKQPGYVKGSDSPASPVEATYPAHPQTPTADTARGPLVGEPGAEEQAEREALLGGPAPAGVVADATVEDASKAAVKKTAAQRSQGRK